MSEALEMLEEIRAIFQGHPGMKQHGDIFEKHLLSPIEKELKDYYALKKECEEAKWYREHKAFEIIKNKKVDIHTLYRGCSILGDTFDSYNNAMLVHRGVQYELTKEEYELLKEVLG